MHHGMFSSILCFYPPDASSVAPHPPVVIIGIISHPCQMSLENALHFLILKD